MSELQLCACSVTKLCLASLQPHGPQPTRLFCPWDFPAKNTGVGCLFLLQAFFLTQGSNPPLLGLLALGGGFFTTSATWEALPTELISKMLSPDHFWAPKPPHNPGASPGSCRSLCPFRLVSAFQVVVFIILCITLGISYKIFCVLLQRLVVNTLISHSGRSFSSSVSQLLRSTPVHCLQMVTWGNKGDRIVE